ncbi:MAG: hypothetical protein ACTHMM_21160 [Agriterribacter sp.]
MDDNKKIKFSIQTQDAPELPKFNSRCTGTYWTWGNDNKLPDTLYRYYEECGLHGSIIKSKYEYVKGRGLKTDGIAEELQKFIGSCNRHGDSLEDVLDKYILDILIYGAGALNIVWNKLGTKISEIYYLDIAQLRYNKEKTAMIYSDDWTKGLRAKTKEYPLFDLENKKGSQVYHYTTPKSKNLYSSPSYSGSIPDILAAINISKFHSAKSANPMQADLFIEFKGPEPEEEEKKEIENYFKRKFLGIDNAGNSIAFGYVKDSTEETRIEAMPDKDSEGKKYLALREEIRQSIITGHQLPSTSLLAIPSPGLSFDSMYEEAFGILQNVVIAPLQVEVMKPLNKLLSINFGSVNLELLPLPIIKSNLTKEQLIYDNMTTEEVRADLVKAGRIKSIEYAPGSLNKEREKQSGSIDQAIINTINKNKNAA